MTDDSTVAMTDNVFAEMKDRSRQGCNGEHDGACCDPELDLHPEDWCDRCLMSRAVQHYDEAAERHQRVRDQFRKWLAAPDPDA